MKSELVPFKYIIIIIHLQKSSWTLYIIRLVYNYKQAENILNSEKF